MKREKNSHCYECKQSVGRLDTHLYTRHDKKIFWQYLDKHYIEKDFLQKYKSAESNVCLICNKEVNWLQTHIETKHELSIEEYLAQFFFKYNECVDQLKANVGYHHLLRPWDSYLIYQKKIDRMVRSISIKKSLSPEAAEDLQGKSIELFLRFHKEYDPNYKTDNPKYKNKKTDDYYEKYIFSKVRAQLGYNVQKYYINRKREFEVGLSDEIELYNREYVTCDNITEDIWSPIREKLSDRQQDVLELLLLGYTQSEISKQLLLTQSWVSSIKALIKKTIKECIKVDPDYREQLRTYYYEGSIS